MRTKSKIFYFVFLLGLALRLSFVFAVPPFAGPDEQCHYDYVKHLVENKTLPADIYQDAHYEYFQAPLYYLTLTPLYALAEGQSPAFRLYLLRLFNFLLAAAILWLAYLILGRTFPGADSLIAGGLAFAAWHPVYARNSVCINNDNLAALISAVLLYFLTNKDLIRKQFNKYAAIGLLWGLGVLAKTSLLAVAPLIFYSANQDGGTEPFKVKGRKGAVLFLLASAIAVMTCGFWLIRNQALYGNLMGMGPYWPRPQAPFSLAFQAATLKHNWVSFWRCFNVAGESGIWEIFKYGWLLFTVGAWIGWSKLLGSKRNLLYGNVGLCLSAVLFLAFYVAGWLYGTIYGKGFHGFFEGRFLFAVMIPAGALFAYGMESIVPDVLKKYIWAAWSLLLALNAGLLLLAMLKVIR
ncbi:hypothetical protein HY768_03120 [candidate division TA06 bacterium]|uniref:Glycosyltransferase RgtA/B/C/D-like domain-containing protein n=1 Tax=candidate division TA06 bacterium TaxID=2250710 RepID=A0A933I9J4_UNCT6|nr:hypothetical protein [candidate division TA06 bacterium]